MSCLDAVNELNLDVQVEKRTVHKIAEVMEKLNASDQKLLTQLKEKSAPSVWTKLQKAQET